ncbi:YceI family protein [Variovorax paradoxus]|uniref:YceI family protein n=1 Tax=Variovorax paradoxus TaxID=34073 RepID=UPI0027831B00|nr:YceI family protein [Variovorax paradoxus]MDP9927838.1 polyisoprenoid-binding protein YceI [Variovorax paradoxus]
MQLKHWIVLVASGLIAAAASAQSYTLDPEHTYPHWSVNHFGLTTFQGKFTRTSGKVRLDPAGQTGNIEITIDPASTLSGAARLDKMMLGEDFFNVEKFPTAVFKSTALRWNGNQLASVDGQLAMVGQTRPVMLTVTSMRCTMHFRLKREVCGIEARTMLNREEWGLGSRFPVSVVGNDIALYIQAEGVRDD